jgi:hypothetical protein
MQSSAEHTSLLNIELKALFIFYMKISENQLMWITEVLSGK